MKRICCIKDTTCGFRRNHSTTTALIKIRDDIIKSMQKGEITLAVFADFSKAFDTVDFSTILMKLNKLGFSKSTLHWFLSYLSGRKQFVQVDNNQSTLLDVLFGVPQGSVLGPVLFNLYTLDLQNHVDCPTLQYADDTTMYSSCKPNKLPELNTKLQYNIESLYQWAQDSNLAFNVSKTKAVLFASTKLRSIHKLENNMINLSLQKTPIETADSWKILGVNFDSQLNWSLYISNVISACHCKLSVLRKIRRITPYKLRKKLAESLVLSKLYYCNALLHNATNNQLQRLQKVQKSAAAYVLGKYCNTIDCINLGWLPFQQQQKYDICKLAFKSIHFSAFINSVRRLKILQITF